MSDEASSLEAHLLSAFTQLHHRSLKVRVQFLDETLKLLQQDLQREKPAPLRKLLRALLNGLLDGYFREQRWTDALMQTVTTLISVADSLPFPLYSTLQSIVSDIVALPHKFADSHGAVRIVHVGCSLLAQSVCSDADWVEFMILTIGKYIDVVADLGASAELSNAGRYLTQLLKHRSEYGVSERCAELWCSSTIVHPAACVLLLQHLNASKRHDLHTNLYQKLLLSFKKRVSSATKQQYMELSAGSWMLFVQCIDAVEWTSDSSSPATPATDSSVGTGEALEVLLAKVMKKAPESSAVLVAAVVRNIARHSAAADSIIDFSRFVNETAAISSLRLLKSNDDAVRTAGLELVQCLVSRCQQSDAYELLVQSLLVGFVGKGSTGVGGLTTAQIPQKICVLGALHYCGAAIVTTLGGAEGVRIMMSTNILLSLQSAIGREQDPNIRLLLARVLGQWLSIGGNGGDSEVAKLMANIKQFLEKPSISHGSVSEANLLGVLMAQDFNDQLLSKSEAMKNGIADLVAPCIALISDAPKKAAIAAHIDAILALRLVLSVVESSSSAFTLMESSSTVWKVALHHESVLFAPQFVKQLCERRDAAAVAAAAGGGKEWFIAQDVDRVICGSGGSLSHEFIGTAVLYDAAVVAMAESLSQLQRIFPNRAQEQQLLLLPPVGDSTPEALTHEPCASAKCLFLLATKAKLVSLRSKVKYIIKNMLISTDSASMQFLVAAWRHVDSEGQTIAKQNAELYCGDSIPSLNIFELLCCAISGGAAMKHQHEHFVALLLMVSAHPIVSTSQRRAVQRWKHVLDILRVERDASSSDCLDGATQSIAKSIIFSLHSNCKLNRTAGCYALNALHSTSSISNAVGINVQEVFDITLKNSIDQLDTTSLCSLEREDVAIFFEKTATVATAIAEHHASNAKASAAEMTITNADRKKSAPRSARRGQFGADAGVEDEDWALRVKQEKAAKLQQQSSNDTDSVEAQIAADIETRWQFINDTVQRYLHALEVLRFFCIIDQMRAQEGLQQLLLTEGLIFHLINSAFVGEVSFATLQILVKKTIDIEIAPLASDLCAALRAIALLLHNKEEVTAQRVQLEPIVRVLQGLLSIISRNTWNQTVAIDDTTVYKRQLKPTTFLLVFPLLRHVFTLPFTLPGTEHSFHLLDRLWPQRAIFIASQDSELHVNGVSRLLQIQDQVLAVCLQAVARPQRTEPNPQKVFLRMCVQAHPLTTAEWDSLVGHLGVLSPEPKVRSTVAQAIVAFDQMDSNWSLTASSLVLCRLWMLQHDEDKVVCGYAEQSQRGAPSEFFDELISLLSHPSSRVRHCAARALAAALKYHCSSRDDSSIAANAIDGLRSLLEAHQPNVTRTVVRMLPKDVKASAGTGKGMKTSKSSTSKATTSESSLSVTVDDQFHDLRQAVALVLTALGEQNALPSDEKLVLSVLSLVVDLGAIDYNPTVRVQMLAAGRSIIDNYGRHMVNSMQVLLNHTLAHEAPTAATLPSLATDDVNVPTLDEAIAEFDNRRSAAVVLLGATGQHLQKDDPVLVEIVQSLIVALRTPSDSVQRSVADCLAPLVQLMKANAAAPVMLNELVDLCLGGATYGDRRGAAFGISAFVKGLGIACLKQHDIITRLRDACASGSVNERQGALFAFEALSARLGLLFEPYIISIIEVLLKSFSHSSDHVRDAAQQAARVIMNKLSAHGVKQILSPILSSLPGETAWKSRQEGIRLLGMMAHCAPKQLASSLPQVVPVLVQAGADPHPKVKDTAKAAMQDISSVIKNPEVARLSPVLLGAIADPASKTKAALETLLETEFMHSIDAASLALLVPILGRSLKDRGADLKRKSAAITGNMVTMVSDTKILSPYLSQLLQGLQDCLLDPIPDVRATSAKAIGSLFVGIGEENEELEQLIPWLLKTIQSDASPVERSGAGQGLAEVCGTAFSEERIEEVVKLALRLQQQGSNAREGLLWFLSFLPATLNERYSAHIDATLPVVLSGLSDESDGVRDVALRAGQVVVFKMGMSHTVELLPALTSGLFEDDWRIRQSSLNLIGELLCLVGDTAGPNTSTNTQDDDDADDGGNAVIAKVGQRIRLHLGDEHTNNVLASLYIARSDVSHPVRQSALMIWKSIVSNSPRTLLQIMGALVKQLIEKLASESELMRTIAGSSLGDIVSKLGDKVLPAVVEPLRQGLRSSFVNEREGVCSGLADILEACNRSQAEQYLDVLVPALQQALCDTELVVRQKAAQAFLRLYRTVGNSAMDEIVPALLHSYGAGAIGETESSNLALMGLQEIVQLRPRDLLDYLLPKLLTSPVHIESSRALGAVLAVAGPQLESYFGTFFPSFINELINMDAQSQKLRAKVASAQEKLAASVSEVSSSALEDLSMALEDEEERSAALKDAVASMMTAVADSAVHQLVTELGKYIDNDSSTDKRRWGCWMAEQAFRNTCASMDEYVAVILKYLLSRVAETDVELLQAVIGALNALVATVPVASLSANVEFMRNCINSTTSSARHRTGAGLTVDSITGELQLPMLSLPKSLDALFTINLHGLMNGTSAAKEAAAAAIGELAQMADFAVLKPLLIKTTGPLIRVVGDRHPSALKAAIIQTMMILMRKGGTALKAFVPQLQTTFVKSLQDPSREVRAAGSLALGRLVVLSVRLDPLLSELSALSVQTDSSAIRASVLEALGTVLTVVGEKATLPVLEEKVASALVKLVFDEDDNVRAMAGRALSRVSWFLSPAAQVDKLIDVLDKGKSSSAHWSQVCGRLIGAGSLLQAAGQNASDEREETYRALQAAVNDERASVVLASMSAITLMLSLPSIVAATGEKVASAAGSLEARAEERKAELRAAAQGVIRIFSPHIGTILQRGSSGDVKAQAVLAVKEAAKNYYGAASQQLKFFVPPLVEALNGIDLRLKYDAERALKLLYDGLTTAELAAGVAPGQGSAMVQYLNSVDKDTASFIRDYAKRVLNRITFDADIN